MAGQVNATPIVALDYPTLPDAMALVDLLGDACRFYKVGSELFTAAGPAIVQSLRDRGCDVFLDLKFHDIPNTVRGGVASAARLGARLVTIHIAGGRAMMAAAVEAAREASPGGSCRVLGITVLTSLDGGSLSEAWGRDLLHVDGEVIRLAELAQSSGVHGVVCSGVEAAAVRARCGAGFDILVPGVRLASGESHDQARVVTPAAAVKAGANYVVLGRAVTAARDSRGAMRQVLAELDR